MKTTSYNKKTVAEITGLTARQVQFYTEQCVLTPEVDPGEGRGKTRLYSGHNLFQFGIIKVLVDLGLQVHKIKFIFDFLDKQAVLQKARARFDQDADLQLYVKFFSGDNYRVELSGVRGGGAILTTDDLADISHCFVINLRAMHNMIR